MSIFLAKTLKIRDGWGFAPRPPQPPAAGDFAPTPPVGAPSLPNHGCATGKVCEVLPPPKFRAGYATEYWKWVIWLSQIAKWVA